MSDFIVTVQPEISNQVVVNETTNEVSVTQTQNTVTVQSSGSQGATGATGPAGPTGPTGPTGPAGGVSSFNARTGVVTLTSEDVTSALTYFPVNKAGDVMSGSLTLESIESAIQNLILKSIDALIDVSAGTRNIITAMGDGLGTLTVSGRMNIISSNLTGGAFINAVSDHSQILAQLSGPGVSAEASFPATSIRAVIASPTGSCGVSAGAYSASAWGYIGDASGSINSSGNASEASGTIADGATSSGISASGDTASARGRVYDVSSSISATGEVSNARGIARDGGSITATYESSEASGYSNGSGATLESSGIASTARGHVYGQGARLESIGTGSVSFGMVTDQNARATSSGEASSLFVRVQDSDSFVESSGKAATIFGVAMGGASMTATERASFINGVSDGSGSSISSQGAATFINASVRNGGTVTVSGECSGFFGVENGTNTSISGTASFGFGMNLNINNDQAFVFGSGITAFGDKSATFGWDGTTSVVIDSSGLNLPLQAGTPGIAYFDSSGNFFSAGSTIEYQSTKRASWSYKYNSYASNWTANLSQGFNTYVGTGGHTCLLPTATGEEGVRITIKHQGSGILTVGTSGSSLFLLDGFPSVALFRGQSVTCVWNGGSWSVLDVNERKIYAAKLATYTVQPSDRFIEATANTFTITLHTAVSYRDAEYEIFNSGSGVITLATTSSQPIYGNGSSATTRTLNQGEYIKVRSNNTGWMITGKN